MSDLLAYHSYPNPAVAQSLVALLEEHGIEFKTHHAPARFSAVLGATTPEQFVVSLRPEDFVRVRQLEESHAADSLAELPADYYLFGFSNAELWEVLSQPAAWSSHDVALASRLLRERGETVTEDTLKELRARHTASLATPSPSPTALILAGYVLALLGGLVGIAIGWSLRRHRKTLPDGRQVLAYSAADQAHGLRIMVLGTVVLLAWIALRLLPLFA